MWCKFWRLQLPKVLRGFQFLTILTSKSLSGAGVVQILAISISKSAPMPSFFNDFDSKSFSRAQAWCKFWQLQLPKVPRPCHFLTILTSKSLSPAGLVQILPHLQQPVLRARPFLGADFPSQRSGKTMEKHSILRASYPPNPHVSHLRLYHICAITSLGRQIFSSKSQYSRKLDS